LQLVIVIRQPTVLANFLCPDQVSGTTYLTICEVGYSLMAFQTLFVNLYLFAHYYNSDVTAH